MTQRLSATSLLSIRTRPFSFSKETRTHNYCIFVEYDNQIPHGRAVHSYALYRLDECYCMLQGNCLHRDHGRRKRRRM